MDLREQRKQEFQARLKRVAAGGPNTLGQVLVGVIDEDTPKTKKRNPAAQGMMLIIAFILGAMAMEAGRLGAFHFLTGDPASLIKKFGELGGFIASNMGDLVIAGFLALIFMYLFHLRGNWRGTALVVGLVSMMLGEIHLIARVPEAFAVMFSQEFVETALTGEKVQPDQVPNDQEASEVLIN